MTWIPDLNTGQGLFALLLVIAIAWTLVRIAVEIRLAIRPSTSDVLDEDELADRIEAAIKDATVDLLNALESIESDTTRAAETLDRIDERHADAVAKADAEAELEREMPDIFRKP